MAAESPLARLRAAGCVFAEDEARLLTDSATTTAELAEMVNRRITGTPLEHVLGWAEFAGLRIVVEPGVFVPRRRTEFLLEQAVALLKTRAVVLDLCCGTGAIGAAVMSIAEDVELHASDIDAAAIRCAKANITRGHVYHGDLFDPLPPTLRGRVNVLIANTPYVPTKEIDFLPAEAREHEPRIALDGGNDGLDVQRRIAAGAGEWLVRGGHLLVETSEKQAATAQEIFARNGFRPSVVSDDERGATVVIATVQ